MNEKPTTPSAVWLALLLITILIVLLLYGCHIPARKIVIDEDKLHAEFKACADRVQPDPLAQLTREQEDACMREATMKAQVAQ